MQNERIDYNDDFFKNILTDVGFFESKYSLNELGLYMFLLNNNINLFFDYSENGFTYHGIDCNDEYNVFTQDFNEYKTFDDVVNVALVEAYCYLSMNKN